MEERVTFIDIGFENLEWITLKVQDIVSMRLEGISENHSIIWCRSENNIEKSKGCSYLHLVISPEANKQYKVFSDKKSKLTVFERIQKFNDIENIGYLNVHEELLDSFQVVWKDKDDKGLENVYQKSFINEKGQLEIIVSKEGAV